MEGIMGKYVHEKKKLHISRHRRKENGTSGGLIKDVAEDDRRHEKEREGIILQDHDRRKKVDPKHSGEEKRSGKDRRRGKDRRG
jgi:hypothetical protein